MQLKKIFVSLLVVIMILSTAVIGAIAADNDVLEFSVAVNATEDKDGNIVADLGDTVEVEVTISNNPGASIIQFSIAYDAEVFEPVTDADGNIVYESEEGNLYSYDAVRTDIPGSIMFISVMNLNYKNVTAEGYVATVNFKVIGNPDGDSSFEVNGTKAFGDASSNWSDVATEGDKCAVTVHDYEEDVDAYVPCTGYRLFVCECGAKYEILDPDAAGHHMVTVEAVAATCTEDGATKKVYCDNEGCTYVELESEVVPATGHTEEILKAVDATCIASGLTEGVKCSVCNTVLVEQAVIPSAAHVEGEWIVDLEPKCNATGSKHKNCVNCDQLMEVQVIPVIPHNNDVVLPAQAATCTTNGLTEGSKCSMCAFVMVEQQVIPATGHTEVVIPAVEPTYSEDGSTEGKQCSTCGAITDAPGVVPAKSLAWLWVLIGAVIVIGAGVAVYFFVLRKKK